MSDVLRSEFRKIYTLRWPYLVTVGVAALTGLGVWSSMGSDALASGVILDGRDAQVSLLDSTGMAAMVSIVIGTMVVASEFRFNTITSALLVTPSRLRLFGAKLMVAGVMGALVGLVLTVVSVIAGSMALADADVAVAVGGLDLAMLAGVSVGGAVAMSLLGAGLAALVGNQAAALGIGVVLTIVVGPIVSGAFPTLGKYLPMEALRAAAPMSAETLGAFTAAAVVAAWVLALCSAGLVRFDRRSW